MSGDMSVRIGQAEGYVQQAAVANAKERTELLEKARQAFDGLKKDCPNDQAVQRSLAKLDYDIKVVDAEGASSLKGLEKLQFLIQMLSPKQRVRDAMKFLQADFSILAELKAAKASGLPKVVEKRVDAKIAKLEARDAYYVDLEKIQDFEAKANAVKKINEGIKANEVKIKQHRGRIREYENAIQDKEKAISQTSDEKEINDTRIVIAGLEGEIARANDAIKESEENITRLTKTA